MIDANRRKVFVALVDQSIVSGSNFITGVLIARNFLPELYGSFYFGFLSIVVVVSIFQRPFIVSPMSVFSQRSFESPMGREGYFSTSFIHQACISFISSLVVCLLLFYRGFVDIRCYLALIGGVWCIQFQELYRSILFAKIEVGKVFLNDVVCYGSRILLIIYAIAIGSQDLHTLLMLGISASLGLVVGYIQTRNPKTISIDGHEMKRAFEFGKWLFLESLLATCSYGGYILAVSVLIDEERFAAFAACDTITKVLNIVFIGLFNVATPMSARKLENDSGGLVGFVNSIRKYGSLFVILVCTGIYILREAIFGVVYDGRFSDYNVILFFLLAANVGFFYQFVSVMVAKVHERSRVVFLARIWASLFTMSGGIFLAYRFSVEGMAVGIAVSSIIGWVALEMYLRGQSDSR